MHRRGNYYWLHVPVHTFLHEWPGGSKLCRQKCVRGIGAHLLGLSRMLSDEDLRRASMPSLVHCCLVLLCESCCEEAWGWVTCSCLQCLLEESLRLVGRGCLEPFAGAASGPAAINPVLWPLKWNRLAACTFTSVTTLKMRSHDGVMVVDH